VELAAEEAAVELAEEPPQALRAAAAPQAAAAVRNERREIFFISVSSFRAVCVSYGGVPRAWEPLAFVDTRIPHRRKNRNGKNSGTVAVFLRLFEKDALSYTGVCTFLLSCTVYILTERKKRIKRTIFMQKAVDKQRRNQYCIKERIQNITGKEAPS
jgi:hypothetical protein